MAQSKDIKTIGFSGDTGGKMKDICDHMICVLRISQGVFRKCIFWLVICFAGLWNKNWDFILEKIALLAYTLSRLHKNEFRK